jgi:hypothetical protein
MATRSPPPALSSARQSLLIAQPAAKLVIRQEAWYRVSQPDLLAAGWDPKADPRLLQLYVDGREVPMLVTGEDDGQFDAADAVEFYGLGLDEAWTDGPVYWLVAGTRPGRRIARVSARGGQPAGISFPYTVERRDRTVYFAALRNGERVTIAGFSSPAIRALDITEADAVREVTDVVQPQDAGWTVAFTVPGSGPNAVERWAPAPRSVVLVGDASLDPKDYLGFGERDHVPTKLIDAAFMQTASDDWLADFDADGLAELAVGRLPVHTTPDAARTVGCSSKGSIGCSMTTSAPSSCFSSPLARIETKRSLTDSEEPMCEEHSPQWARALTFRPIPPSVTMGAG